VTSFLTLVLSRRKTCAAFSGRERKEGRKVVEKFYQLLKTRRRRRALAHIRREFAKAGYPLDQFGDSQIEAAVTRWNDDIAAFTVSAKSIYRALKRLPRFPGSAQKSESRVRHSL
jgi:hypothetical protein